MVIRRREVDSLACVRYHWNLVTSVSDVKRAIGDQRDGCRMEESELTGVTAASWRFCKGASGRELDVGYDAGCFRPT